MDKLRVLSLFSGIGAFELALRNIDIDYELVNYCEIDKYASKSYCAIHGVDENLNLWDITKININNLPNDIDMITHGSPCQSFSIAGLQHGGDEGSETRSSLMWNTVEIVKHCKPKYIIWENVKNVLSKNHRHNFDKYIKTLETLGYTNYWQVLNAKDYGVPQNRERIFVVSILGEHKLYEFPKGFELNKRIHDFLDEDDIHGEKNNILVDENIKPSVRKNFEREKEMISLSNKSIYTCKCTSGWQDNKVGIQVTPTIRANNSFLAVYDNYKIKKISPNEAFRLMGFTDEDFYKAKETGISNSQLYKQAGNSIVVNVLEEIFRNLFLK